MNPLRWLLNLARTSQPRPGDSRGFFFPRTRAGEYVDEDAALKYSAVWACVRIISEDIAGLPWCVYQRTNKGRTEDLSSTIYWLLHVQPNPEMSAFSFKELMVRRALLSGNAYAEIERDSVGRPLWLWPIESDRVRAARDPETGRLYYEVADVEKGRVELDPADVYHLRGPGGDGIVGYSMIRYAAESMGLGLGMETFAASFFGNGASPSVILTHPKSLKDGALKNLKDSLKEKFGGKNAHSPIVLEEGMTMEKLTMTPEEAQFLESRKHGVGDVARWYRIPPHKLGLLDRATWANIEQQGIEYVQDAIVPWCVRMEQEADLKLYGRKNRGVYYTKLNVAALMRGDMASRYKSYAVGRQWGWLNADDVRDLEEMNPLPNGEGKLYLVPVNMTTPELLKKGPATQPTQAPAPEDEDDPEDELEQRRQSMAALRARNLHDRGTRHA